MAQLILTEAESEEAMSSAHQRSDELGSEAQWVRSELDVTQQRYKEARLELETLRAELAEARRRGAEEAADPTPATVQTRGPVRTRRCVEEELTQAQAALRRALDESAELELALFEASSCRAVSSTAGAAAAGLQPPSPPSGAGWVDRGPRADESGPARPQRNLLGLQKSKAEATVSVQKDQLRGVLLQNHVLQLAAQEMQDEVRQLSMQLRKLGPQAEDLPEVEAALDRVESVAATVATLVPGGPRAGDEQPPGATSAAFGEAPLTAARGLGASAWSRSATFGASCSGAAVAAALSGTSGGGPLAERLREVAQGVQLLVSEFAAGRTKLDMLPLGSSTECLAERKPSVSALPPVEATVSLPLQERRLAVRVRRPSLQLEASDNLIRMPQKLASPPGGLTIKCTRGPQVLPPMNALLLTSGPLSGSQSPPRRASPSLPHRPGDGGSQSSGGRASPPKGGRPSEGEAAGTRGTKADRVVVSEQHGSFAVGLKGGFAVVGGSKAGGQR